MYNWHDGSRARACALATVRKMKEEQEQQKKKNYLLYETGVLRYTHTAQTLIPNFLVKIRNLKEIIYSVVR